MARKRGAQPGNDNAAGRRTPKIGSRDDIYAGRRVPAGAYDPATKIYAGQVMKRRAAAKGQHLAATKFALSTKQNLTNSQKRNLLRTIDKSYSSMNRQTAKDVGKAVINTVNAIGAELKFQFDSDNLIGNKTMNQLSAQIGKIGNAGGDE